MILPAAERQPLPDPAVQEPTSSPAQTHTSQVTLFVCFISGAKLPDPGIRSFSSYPPFNQAGMSAPELAAHCQPEPLKHHKVTARPRQGNVGLGLASWRAAAGRVPGLLQPSTNPSTQGRCIFFIVTSVEKGGKIIHLRMQPFRPSHDSFKARANGF